MSVELPFIYEFLDELYVDRDEYSRGKIIELIREYIRAREEDDYYSLRFLDAD